MKSRLTSISSKLNRTKILSDFALKILISLLAFSLLSCNARSQELPEEPETLAENHRLEIHCKHFLLGYPYGAPLTNDLIIRDIYAMSSNDSTKLADWVVWQLTKNNLGDAKTDRSWEADPWLAEDETLEPNDYRGAHGELHTDRGHQAPLASFDGTPYWEQTNYLSNITPQKSALNQGPWRLLEEAERDLLKKYILIYVMTGPLYEREMPPLPGADEYHAVPSGYWRIITTIDEDLGLKIAAYILDQDTPRKAVFNDYLVTVDEIERRSGLDFFWELEDEIEDYLEMRYDKAWILENLR